MSSYVDASFSVRSTVKNVISSAQACRHSRLFHIFLIEKDFLLLPKIQSKWKMIAIKILCKSHLRLLLCQPRHRRVWCRLCERTEPGQMSSLSPAQKSLSTFFPASYHSIHALFEKIESEIFPPKHSRTKMIFINSSSLSSNSDRLSRKFSRSCQKKAGKALDKLEVSVIPDWGLKKVHNFGI